MSRLFGGRLRDRENQLPAPARESVPAWQVYVYFVGDKSIGWSFDDLGEAEAIRDHICETLTGYISVRGTRIRAENITHITLYQSTRYL